MQPIFISVDPARDSTSQIARYVSEFHPRLIGLSGDYAATKAICKAYRVYFSTPPDAKAEDDYLVDHSIFFYFMDPDGKFVDAFGKVSTVEDVVARVQKEIAAWKDNEEKAAGLICLALEELQMVHIEVIMHDPGQLWRVLEAYHVQKQPTSCFVAFYTLLGARKADSKTLPELTCCLKGLHNNIKRVLPKGTTSDVIIEELLCISLMHALPMPE